MQPPAPSMRSMIKGAVTFSKNAATTLPTLIREVARTAFQTVSHDAMNTDQLDFLRWNPVQIAVLVPWFQLDGSSLSSIKSAFNNRRIPALFPEWLPFGIDAIMFRDHPHILVEKIIQYVASLREKYPDAEIILLGHSFGWTETLHVADLLDDEKIIPVTFSGLLAPLGAMAYAPHGLYYGHMAHICAWNDPGDFIMQAQKIQLGCAIRWTMGQVWKNVLTIVNFGDGYLPIPVQAGCFSDNLSNSRVIIPEGKTPRHYVQGRSPIFSRDVVGLVLEQIAQRKTTRQ